MIKIRGIMIPALSLIAIGSTVSCHQPGVTAFGPHTIGQNNFCKNNYDNSKAPAASELNYFVSRIDGGVVTLPIEAGCIERFFNDNSLKAWAEQGDPVAKYILVYISAKSGNLCRQSAINRILLIDSLNADFNIGSGENSKTISRVPEAALGLASIDIQCFSGSGKSYYDLAHQRGYDITSGVEE